MSIIASAMRTSSQARAVKRAEESMSGIERPPAAVSAVQRR
jgi:hypothetical protein